ncbi:MAG TPA: fused MFS/spermidine synthase [Candidatus Deferrimicrobium sp.]|nr:fused MFS/spermidine synthase [Candidatus Kapabacteria bacterium]HLP57449.1 fused MFS/spermidine synthase [Candidatus Deferrimicrobium sp.]
MQEKEILLKRKTAFNNFSVTRQGNTVTLWSPPGRIKQTTVDIDNPSLPGLEYARNCILSLAFHPNPGSLLVLGLGGGAVPMMFYHIFQNIRIDVVEIDPVIYEVAEKYFNFITDSRVTVYIDDASLFLKKNGQKYDIIIMDAFIGQKQNSSLTAEKFFLAAAQRLNPEGLFVTNLMTKYENRFEKMKLKLGKTFSSLWLFHGEISANALAFAKNEKITKKHIIKNIKRLPVPIPWEAQRKLLAGRII